MIAMVSSNTLGNIFEEDMHDIEKGNKIMLPL